MRILALDTSTEACSVAYLEGGELLERHEEVGRAHATRLLPLIGEVMGAAAVELGSLDVLAVGVGPGSFTGIRIGVACAQGIAFGAGLPAVPVSSLEALAFQAVRELGATRILACIDARMREVYWQLFSVHADRQIRAESEPRVDAPGDVLRELEGQSWCGIGRGIPVLSNVGMSFDSAHPGALPRAGDAARLARSRFLRGEHVAPQDLVPVYVRDRVAQTTEERARAGA